MDSIHEFLHLTCGESIVEDVLTNGRKFYKWRREPFVPVEFSVAAYRFGTARSGHRTAQTSPGRLEADSSSNLSSKAVRIMRHPSRTTCRARRGGLGDSSTGGRFLISTTATPGPNKKIDTILSSPLFALPRTVVPHPHPASNPSALAQRNLLRHLAFSLPAGQRVARAMAARVSGIVPLSDEDFDDLRPHGLHNRVPLWFYCLREAAVTHNGQRLGPVGARIVAEVFVGLMQGDDKSFLTQEPDWRPVLPTVDTSNQGDDFSMIDLLRFAGVA
jgi:hypothetical protein